MHVPIHTLYHDPELMIRSSYSPTDHPEVAESLATHGWDASRPVAVVRRPDGNYTIIDGNVRVVVARCYEYGLPNLASVPVKVVR